MSRLRVSFVCQWFKPEPVSQPGWIVHALARRGAHVEVLTGVPNYPSGRVQSGYRAWRATSETVDGIEVHRTPLFPSHDASAPKRIINYLSWGISAALLGGRHLRKADVALVYSSPATAAIPAIVARRLYGVPFVLLIQDVWPDSIFSSGFLQGRLGSAARWLTNIFVKLTYREASEIAVISPGMVDLLVARGVPKDKLSLIYNWVEERQPELGSPSKLRNQLGLQSDDFIVMYAGNHGSAQALDSVIRGFALIASTDRCHLVLVGDGVEKRRLRALAEDLCRQRVHFVDPQPRERMPALMSEADLQLVSLADRPLFEVTMPSKLQSVLAAGQPVLVAASGDPATVVELAAAGAAAPPENPSALAAAVLAMRRSTPKERRRMGRNGKAHYQQHMSEPVGARRLLSVLAAAAETGTPSTASAFAKLEGCTKR